MIGIFATKAKDWEHEAEWRIIRRTGRGEMLFKPSALDGVIMGCKMPPKDETWVRGVLARRNPPVELLKAHVAEREFKLDIRSA